ncbi:von Willebrand factor A domain-containing protein 7-like [Panulirus ornatus]|uniref:von Willebrand factor A domain-containing protein 7-like n=1 Tax=Panulirus ornatus TaxID=150431 RepID=UPI003A8A53C8
MLRERIARLNPSCVESSSRILLLVVVVVVLVVAPEPAGAFLGRGTLLETEGDIFGIYCPGFDRDTRVWHHREITREAVRRVVFRYFQEVAPAVGVYNHRPDLTLEEAYAEYYGDTHSPKPFLSAVSTLVDAVAEADTGLLGADPRYHFGNERFSESQENLKSRWRRIIKAGVAGDYSATLHLVGLSLATIQDFYSHTNWIELGNTDFNRDIGISGKNFTNVAGFREGTCKDCPDAADGVGSCPDNLLQEILDQKKLTSGYNEDAYVDGVRTGKPKGVNKCSHGGPRDRSHWVGARGGINKELPTACFSPHHQLHEQAAEQAVRASEHYLNLVRGGVGNALFSRLMGLHPTPALVIVLDTTDSMDEELTALTHSVNRLVKQHETATYPPAEYILVPFNDPEYGPVTRSQQPHEIYDALTREKARDGGDEAELSMAALRLALHYAPLHSHVFLFTDASIKDPELFDAVLTLALSKNIKVTTVLTMPVRHGGISGRIELLEEDDDLQSDENSYNHRIIRENRHVRLGGNNRNRRQKRQLQSLSKYSALAQRTGGQLIETTGEQTEETSRILEAKQYPMAILWRVFDVNSPQTVRVPVDSLVKELEVSISGEVDSALLVSPKGVNIHLVARSDFDGYQGYRVVALTRYFIQVRINTTQREDFGEWTLKFHPTDVASAVISAHTPMDILPVFYTPDAASNQPSLQRNIGQPSRGSNTYLDIVITGVDTARLQRVESAQLLDAAGERVTLDMPVKSPRRNTYLSLPTRQIPQERFTVALVGKDASGHQFRRESGLVWEMVNSVLAFPLGRDIWGPPGSKLTIPITITNTNVDGDTTNTYFITAYDISGSTVTLNQTRVKLERKKTAPLSATVEVSPRALPYSTNTLVVTATSNRGDTSQALAHISVTSRDTDRVAPTCKLHVGRGCSGHLTAGTCRNNYWTADVVAEDYDSGLLQVKSFPEFDFTNFVSGAHSVTLRYTGKCCKPTVTIEVLDVAGNLGTCSTDISNGEGDGDDGNPQLRSGEVAGIVVGSVLGAILLVLLVVFAVIYRRRHKRENVTPKRARRRSSSE